MERGAGGRRRHQPYRPLARARAALRAATRRQVDSGERRRAIAARNIRPSPRGAPRDAQRVTAARKRAFAVAGTPLRGPLYSSPSKRPWIRAGGGDERARCEQRADPPHPWTIRASESRRSRHAMKLADLLTVDAVIEARFATLDLAGVSADSRTIKRGDLFVAVGGAEGGGGDFLSQAGAARGAAGVGA